MTGRLTSRVPRGITPALFSLLFISAKDEVAALYSRLDKCPTLFLTWSALNENLTRLQTFSSWYKIKCFKARLCNFTTNRELS